MADLERAARAIANRARDLDMAQPLGLLGETAEVYAKAALSSVLLNPSEEAVEATARTLALCYGWQSHDWAVFREHARHAIRALAAHLGIGGERDG